jgi:hypothetical protein
MNNNAPLTWEQKEAAGHLFINGFWVLCFVLGVLFFLPSVIAALRGHRYFWAILALNLFYRRRGGWAITLAWAVAPNMADPRKGD